MKSNSIRLGNVVASVLFAAVSALPAASQTVLSFTTSDGPNMPSGQIQQAGAEKVAEVTNGEVAIEFYWQQSLSKAGDNLDAIGDGLADLGQVIASRARGKMPLHYLTSTSVGSGDAAAVALAWNETREAYPELAAEAEAANLHYLYNYSIGPGVLIGNRTFASPEDFKGAPMRLNSHFSRTAAEYKWDVNPVRVLFPEMYQSLERGVVEGGAAYVSQLEPFRLNEVASHATVLDLGQHMHTVYMNLDTWNGLSAENQQAITATLPQLILDLAQSEVDTAAATVSKLGGDSTYPMEFVVVGEDKRSLWQDALMFS